MDAGLAAVLGAAVGALGTGGAAVLAAWWSATAQERRAHRQIRFEHLRDRREPRSRAYAEVVAQIQRMGRRLDQVNERDRARDLDLDGFPQEIDKLADLCARVAVEGPAPIADQAQRILVLTRMAFSAASDLLTVPVDEIDEHEEDLWRSRDAAGDLNAELGRFLELARLALDDAGSC
ncbi:hypothetical protein ABZ837_33230 [Streptomyces sp. NPDC047197]|uniref:hypothetical protein n=1 Tax=Streptomyces sp. NPDC047197 TaxID=3155477 RepID=UPI0033F9FDB8